MVDEERPETKADLAEGYRRRAERDARITAEMESSAREATKVLGDAPEW